MIVEGSVSAALVTLLQTAVLRMIPYAVPGLMLLLLDLVMGCQAAMARGERVRFSTAIRRTMTKMFEYICFIVLATTLAISFDKNWLEWVVLGLVYGNEFVSVIGNYLETKGMKFSIVGVYKWLLKFFARKAGGELSEEEANEIIQPRDAKGRFVKKTK